jgi:ATP-dependent HslUV protease ATP-binding subunit HslU
VESIIRDLADTAVNLLRQEQIQALGTQAEDRAEERILDALLPPPRNAEGEPDSTDSSTRQMFRKKLRQGELDDKEIDIELAQVAVGVEIMTPPGMEEMTNQLQNMFANLGQGKTKQQRLTIKEARKRLQDEEAAGLVNEDEIRSKAVTAVEQTGIVFIDELDKVAKRSETSGTDVSREGVQRDLLPLIEGCTVTTKYGPISTDHVLFIGSGAFHLAKPSDLIPELQGRLPIRVELQALSPEDFKRILTEPKASLCEQYQALMAAEQVTIHFDPSGIDRIAELAWQVNEGTENIGARRLHTVMERLLEPLSFAADEYAGQTVLIDQGYVDEHLSDLVSNTDLSRFIL